MKLASQVWMLRKAVCISHCSNTLGKGMHPSILSLLLSGNIRVDWGL